MSGENRINAAPLPLLPPPVYTIHHDFQGNRYSQCQGGNCQAPPPKYEDVISGEYLKSNYSNCGNFAPGYQSVNVCHHCTCTRIRTDTLVPELSSQDDYKDTKCNPGWFVLLAFIFIGLFIWRAYFLSSH